MRVLVRKESGDSRHSQKDDSGATDHGLSAVIVEATEQRFDEVGSIPNASMDAVAVLVRQLGAPEPDRMIVAPASAVKHCAHGGLIVESDRGVRHTCAAVVTLIAHVGKCNFSDLPEGHRMETTSVWNIPFEGVAEDETGDRPAHASAELENTQLIAYCTMSNMQFFTLASRRPREAVYAMVVLSSSHNLSSGETKFMVSKVQQLKPEELVSARHLFRKLWTLSRRFGGEQWNAFQVLSPDAPATPFQVRKARKLGHTPTDESMVSNEA